MSFSKTLVLLQHAAYYADRGDDRPLLFVTMSPRLRSKLQNEYEFMNEVSNGELPVIRFFSFPELLTFLVQLKSITEFDELSLCNFLGYTQAQKSHQKGKILEPQLVESEVGGVILGSLTSAQQCSPLSCEEYLKENRSNCGNFFEADLELRREVYSQYESYALWKRKNEMYDVNDVVMRLLREEWKELFSSGTFGFYCIFMWHSIGDLFLLTETRAIVMVATFAQHTLMRSKT